jgi:hypothetical protein
MEQLDLIVLTSIIVIAFIAFILATYKEFRYMENNPFERKKEND